MSKKDLETDLLDETSFEHDNLSARREQRRRATEKHKKNAKDPSSHYRNKKSAMRLKDRDEDAED